MALGGPLGLWAGPFWAFSGYLGLLDVILGRYAAAGTATRINGPSNLEIQAFLASFCEIWQYLSHFLPLWGPFGTFLVPF